MRRTIASLYVLLAVAVAETATAQINEYYHLDALGNVRVVTDQGGNVIERHDYLPFGEECTTGPCAGNPPGSNTKKFTGKERDQETGFDYFGARYYGQKTARFTSTDPVYTWRENLVDPQRWNRYAYARNNPLRYVDPDGREVKYGNDTVKEFVSKLANLYGNVKETLALYEGSGRPDLYIRVGDPGKDRDGMTRGAASFDPTFRVAGAFNPAEDAEKATAATLLDATMTISRSVRLDTGDEESRYIVRHEFGHADSAARNPRRHVKLDANVRNRNLDGSLMKHDDRPLEKEADCYAGRPCR